MVIPAGREQYLRFGQIRKDFADERIDGRMEGPLRPLLQGMDFLFGSQRSIPLRIGIFIPEGLDAVQSFVFVHIHPPPWLQMKRYLEILHISAVSVSSMPPDA